ncbi:MAG: hypothetical protein K8S97_06585 [Anaerolineae bacterium]|nr:hypothetical protein [Anaerolineae bacterium]
MARRGRQPQRRGQQGGGMRDRLQRMRDINRTQIGIVLAALVLAITIFFPRFYPAAKRGPVCSNLSAPLGGNNRSVLAFNSNQRNNLELDLELDNATLDPNQPLIVRVSFRNEDPGAMILYLPNQDPVPVNQTLTQGISFEITLRDNPVGAQGTVITTSPATFTNPNLLHLLGSSARCHEEYVFSADMLARLNIQAGNDYRIRAFYSNNSNGDLSQADIEKNQGLTPTSSPFPEYLDNQGVWTGDVSSKEERFTISLPQPAAPAP